MQVAWEDWWDPPNPATKAGTVRVRQYLEWVNGLGIFGDDKLDEAADLSDPETLAAVVSFLVPGTELPRHDHPCHGPRMTHDRETLLSDELVLLEDSIMVVWENGGAPPADAFADLYTVGDISAGKPSALATLLHGLFKAFLLSQIVPQLLDMVLWYNKVLSPYHKQLECAAVLLVEGGTTGRRITTNQLFEAICADLRDCSAWICCFHTHSQPAYMLDLGTVYWSPLPTDPSHLLANAGFCFSLFETYEVKAQYALRDYLRFPHPEFVVLQAYIIWKVLKLYPSLADVSVRALDFLDQSALLRAARVADDRAKKEEAASVTPRRRPPPEPPSGASAAAAARSCSPHAGYVEMLREHQDGESPQQPQRRLTGPKKRDSGTTPVRGGKEVERPLTVGSAPSPREESGNGGGPQVTEKVAKMLQIMLSAHKGDLLNLPISDRSKKILGSLGAGDKKSSSRQKHAPAAKSFAARRSAALAAQKRRADDAKANDQATAAAAVPPQKKKPSVRESMGVPPAHLSERGRTEKPAAHDAVPSFLRSQSQQQSQQSQQSSAARPPSPAPKPGVPRTATKPGTGRLSTGAPPPPSPTREPKPRPPKFKRKTSAAATSADTDGASKPGSTAAATTTTTSRLSQLAQPLRSRSVKKAAGGAARKSAASSSAPPPAAPRTPRTSSAKPPPAAAPQQPPPPPPRQPLRSPLAAPPRASPSPPEREESPLGLAGLTSPMGPTQASGPQPLPAEAAPAPLPPTGPPVLVGSPVYSDVGRVQVALDSPGMGLNRPNVSPPRRGGGGGALPSWCRPGVVAGGGAAAAPQQPPLPLPHGSLLLRDSTRSPEDFARVEHAMTEFAAEHAIRISPVPSPYPTARGGGGGRGGFESPLPPPSAAHGNPFSAGTPMRPSVQLEDDALLVADLDPIRKRWDNRVCAPFLSFLCCFSLPLIATPT